MLLKLLLLLLLLSQSEHAPADAETVFDKRESHVEKLFQSFANGAIVSLNGQWNDRNYWKLDRMVSAGTTRSQQSDGQRRSGFELKYLIVRTECRKEEDKSRVELGLCSVEEEAPKQECILHVFFNPEELVMKGCKRITTEMKSPPEAAGQTPSSSSDVAAASATVKEEANNSNVSAKEQTRRALLDAVEAVVKPREQQSWSQFREFVGNFDRVYANKREVLKRFRIYRKNMVLARKWQEQEQGTAEYGETPFADMSMSEFQQTMLPYQWPQDQRAPLETPPAYLKDMELPASWDWRQKGAVTRVKNQGMCGSCWAFSVTGNIEGQWALKKGKLQELSEQELLDCDKVDLACSGGLPLNAYKEIVRIGGLEPEQDYPYDAHKESCSLNRSEIAVYINSSVQLQKDEAQMAAWLVQHGPISVGVNALPLQFYRHGIAHPWRIFCSPQMLNHGVLIVGFGQEGNKPFWIIKNSWGPAWGEQGYYRLYRGQNVCGVHEMATSALIY